jgi:hypothetical protein
LSLAACHLKTLFLDHKSMKNILSLAFSSIAIFTLASAPSKAFTIFLDREDFLAELDEVVVDDYSDPGYKVDSFSIDDAAMSAVIGETQYTSTSFPDFNLVFGETYCTGCNGSFNLDFTSTSVRPDGRMFAGTSSLGVYGAGFEIVYHEILDDDGQPPYEEKPLVAFVDFFAGGRTENFYLPVTHTDYPDLNVLPEPTFWGITSERLIQSIHVGLEDGNSLGSLPSTAFRAISIDDLTIGSAPVGVTQYEPILPSAGSGFKFGVASDALELTFENVESGLWFDPPTAYGFEYRMLDDSLFTNILDFPLGFNNAFSVEVCGNLIKELLPDNMLDFTQVCGSGVSTFKILDVSPPTDLEVPAAFP